MFNTVDNGRNMISTYAAFESYVKVYCRKRGLVTKKMLKRTRVSTFLEKTDTDSSESLLDDMSASDMRQEDLIGRLKLSDIQKIVPERHQAEVNDAAADDTTEGTIFPPATHSTGRPSNLARNNAATSKD